MAKKISITAPTVTQEAAVILTPAQKAAATRAVNKAAAAQLAAVQAAAEQAAAEQAAYDALSAGEKAAATKRKNGTLLAAAAKAAATKAANKIAAAEPAQPVAQPPVTAQPVAAAQPATVIPAGRTAERHAALLAAGAKAAATKRMQAEAASDFTATEVADIMQPPHSLPASLERVYGMPAQMGTMRLMLVEAAAKPANADTVKLVTGLTVEAPAQVAQMGLMRRLIKDLASLLTL